MLNLVHKSEQVLQGDSHLSDSGIIDQLCPYCENLFDEVDLLTELILEVGRI